MNKGKGTIRAGSSEGMSQKLHSETAERALGAYLMGSKVDLGTSVEDSKIEGPGKSCLSPLPTSWPRLGRGHSCDPTSSPCRRKTVNSWERASSKGLEGVEDGSMKGEVVA